MQVSQSRTSLNLPDVQFVVWREGAAGSFVHAWLQELAEELEDLHDTVDDVLAILHRVMGS